MSNGDLTGTGNRAGAVRTVVCDTGYVEQLNVTTITCESSGTWSHTPMCIIPGNNNNKNICSVLSFQFIKHS